MSDIKRFAQQDWSNSGGNGMGIMGPSEGGLGFGTPGGGGEGLGSRINLPPSHQGHSGNLAPGSWSGDSITDEPLKTGFFSQSVGDFTPSEIINKIRALTKINTPESRDLVVFLKQVLDDKMRRLKKARRHYDVNKIAANSAIVEELKQDPFTVALFNEHNVPISELHNVEIPIELSHFALHTLVHKIAATDSVDTIEQDLDIVEPNVEQIEDHTEDRIDNLEKSISHIPNVDLVDLLGKVKVLQEQLSSNQLPLDLVNKHIKNYAKHLEKLKKEIESPTQQESSLMTLINAILVRMANALKNCTQEILRIFKEVPISNWPDLVDSLKKKYTKEQLEHFFEYSSEWENMLNNLKTKFGAGEANPIISKQDFYDFYTAMLALTYSADAPSSVQSVLEHAILRVAKAVLDGVRFGIRYHIEYPLLGGSSVWEKVKATFGDLQETFTAFHNDTLSTEDLATLTYLVDAESPNMINVWKAIANEAVKLDKLIDQGVDLQAIAQQTDRLIDYAHHRGKIGEDWLPMKDVFDPTELMTEKSEEWDEEFLQKHSPRLYNIYKRLQRISKLKGFIKFAQSTAQPFKGECPESGSVVYTTHSQYVQNDFMANCPEGKRKLENVKSVSIEEYKKNKKKRKKKKQKGYRLVSTKTAEMDNEQELKPIAFTSHEKSVINKVREAAEALDINTYLVGGAVRDKLLGKEETDMDFLCEKDAEKIVIYLAEKYGNTDPIQYGRSQALMVTIDKTPLDFINTKVLFKPFSKGGTLEGEEEFTTSLDDAYRRDLTINSLMYDIRNGKLIDPTGQGLQDLKKGVLNTIIDPFIKYKIHAVDMLRAIRFAATLGFDLGPNMIEAMKANAARVLPRDKGGDISNRRVRRELRKAIDDPRHWAKMREILSQVGLDIILSDDIQDVQADFEGAISYYWPEKQASGLRSLIKTQNNDNIEESVIKQHTKISGILDFFKGKDKPVTPTTGKERCDYRHIQL